jgi:hypothetical protein
LRCNWQGMGPHLDQGLNCGVCVRVRVGGCSKSTKCKRWTRTHILRHLRGACGFLRDAFSTSDEGLSWSFPLPLRSDTAVDTVRTMASHRIGAVCLVAAAAGAQPTTAARALTTAVPARNRAVEPSNAQRATAVLIAVRRTEALTSRVAMVPCTVDCHHLHKQED